MFKQKAKTCLELFCAFFKIGLFTFGGGYAMIPLIQREAVEKKKWITDADMLDIIAIAESTPGPIAINSSTFIGYQTAGVISSACATMGVVLPSFLIIFTLSSIIRQFTENVYVQYAFFGIRAGVLALIVKALITMIKQCPKNVFSYVIAALAFIATTFFSINVLYVIIASALIGLIWSLTIAKGGDKA